jgi:hypothetical protein
MKLQLKNTPEQVELIKAMGSRNQTVSREAQEAFAAFIGPVIQKVLQVAGTASSIYSDAPFNQDDSASYPLDLYYNENNTGYISVWSQHVAGGLPTSTDVSAIEEMKIATYRLDSALSYYKRYARQARLDIVSKALERMAQEILIKQERNAWAVILRALAEATTSTSTAPIKASGGDGGHILPGWKKGQFVLHDLNRLMTLNRRINEAWAGGTPEAAYSNGVTDLYVSPEVKEQVRSFAYNPLNTAPAATNPAPTAAGIGAIPLPDGMRADIYRSAGMQEIYGVNIVELLELGVGKKYNTLFNDLVTVNSGPYNHADGHFAGSATAGAAEKWDSATDEVLVGVDNSRGAFIRAVSVVSETGATFDAVPDDQFVQRSDKIGFYGSLEEGRVCLDGRAVQGIAL